MGKAKRERAREKRDTELERARERAEASRRSRQRWLLIGVPALIAVIVAIALIGTLSGGGSSTSGDGSSTAGLKEIAGVHQAGLVLGNPNAPVQIREFADLQCPVCKRFSETVLPKLIGDVKAGKVKIVYEPFAILGPDSETAADALYATVTQNKAWNFITTFYANQRQENTGYVTDAFVDKIAKTAGVDVKAMRSNLTDQADTYSEQRDATKHTASGYGYKSTPTIRIEGPGGVKTMSDPFDVNAIKAAIHDLATKSH